MRASHKQSVLSLGSLALFLSLAPAVHMNSGFDIEAALRYLPSKVIGAIGFVIYFIISSLLLWRLVRNRDWWGLCLPIGGFGEALGFLLRVFISQPKLRISLGFYIVMDFFVVLSPAAFLAFNYITYGRLIRLCIGREHSFIRPERVGLTFVLSDIFTFLVQGAGGAMEVQTGTATAGRDIFLIGIVGQGVSYVIYDFLVAASHRSVRRAAKHTRQKERPNEPWCIIFKLIYFSSLFIIIRSIYRVIETVQGREGYLFTHEWCFLVFDSIPLAIATTVYIFFWPGNYVSAKTIGEDISLHSSPGASTHQAGMNLVTTNPERV